MHLSYSDVERLAQEPSPRLREEVAARIATGFIAGQLGGREKDVAVEIFRLLANDAERRVRACLSQHLRACNALPRDVALRLAHDMEDSVAVPMLEYSQVLDERDLLALVASARSAAQLCAVARREAVSEVLSDALLCRRDTSSTIALLANKGADIAEASLIEMVEAMASRESVIDALMQRGGLPVVCVEKIFMSVSTQMKQKLAERYQLSRHILGGKLEYAREMTTLGVSSRADNINVEALVKHMRTQRKLTSSVVIRSLCVGDMRFFEYAMAELTDVPLENVRRLLLDAGPNGFKSLYRLSPLPPAYFAAVKTLLDLALELTRNGTQRRDDFTTQVIDKILANRYDRTVEHMPLLLAIIKGNASELSSIH